MVTMTYLCTLCLIFFFKQKTAYEMRISDWSSDVCSSDLQAGRVEEDEGQWRIDAPPDVINAAVVRPIGGVEPVHEGVVGIEHKGLWQVTGIEEKTQRPAKARQHAEREQRFCGERQQAEIGRAHV